MLKGTKRQHSTAYAELQATSNFTFLEGGSHAEELVATARALGLSALAITDRNTLAGVVRAHLAAKEVGLRLIVGARLDLVDAPSLLCLPRDREAYARLSRLLSLGQRRAGKGHCILSLADVAAHAEGQILIALPPERWDWREAPGEAATEASTVPIFEHALQRLGAALPSPLYLAATHRLRGEDRARLAALAVIAERTGALLVATGDVLYHAPHRRPLQDVLTAIREKCTLAEAGTRLEVNAERHLKSPAEIARLLRGHEPAIARTLAIADACRFCLDELV